MYRSGNAEHQKTKAQPAGSIVIAPASRVGKWRAGWMSLLLLVGLGAWAGYSWANQPQVAVLGVMDQRPIAESPTTGQLQEIITEFYTTKIPTIFTVRERHDEKSGNTLGSLVAGETADGSGQLAIMVRTLPDGGIAQSSDVRFRQLHDDIYSEVTFDWLPAGAKAYRGSGTYELGVFMAHGSQYISIVLSNNKSSPVYDEWLRTTMEHWRWPS